MSTNTLPSHTASLLGGFDEAAFDALSSPGPSLLLAKRRAAFEAYAAIPNPTARDEEYRRMDPNLFKFGSFTRLNLPAEPVPYRADPMDSHFDLVIAVSPVGVSVHDPEGIAGKEGVTVCTLDQAAEQFPTLVERSLGAAMSAEEPRKFFELNSAFWNVGFLIYVRKGVELPKGILLRYHNDQPGSALLPRLLVVAEREARFSLAEEYTSPDGVPTLCVSTREFHLDAAADVKLVSVQDWGNAGIHLGEDWARVERDAKVDLFSMTLGGKVSKMSVGCDVHQENANAYLGGLFFANGKQHFDQRTLQLHSAPHTYSNMLYKGAVKDKGYSVYQGIIRARHRCIGVDAYQTNNNLVLDPGARADSLPGLIIDADELACSHGATMGNLDPAQIHYLRSRGISLADARRMLVIGFFEEVVERVPFEVLRDRLHQVIETKLQG